MFASLRIRTALVFLLILSVPAVAGAATIALAWNANSEANIAGYRVHYGTQAGSYTTIIDRGNTLTASVTGLAAGTRYYFVVVAYDTNGGQSSFSAEVNDMPPPGTDTHAARCDDDRARGRGAGQRIRRAHRDRHRQRRGRRRHLSSGRRGGGG